jgi:uncharacterized membrane protein YphA (DoxX/SURF4 family)
MAPAPISTLLDAGWFRRVACAVLTIPYWLSGIDKLLDLEGALAEAGHFGLQPAWTVVAATIIVQIGGSLLAILGRQAWLGAGALGVFTALATIIAHPYWQIADPLTRFHERNTFFEHAGLIGGLMLAAILGERTRQT